MNASALEASVAQRGWERFILAGSSVFGLGYLPLAPGTWGTFAALPLWWCMRDLPVSAFALITAALVGVAVWFSSRAERIYDSHDVGHIVIDEVVGLLCTVIAVPFRWPQVLAAFVLFRLLDALKPPPIRWFDRNVHGGFGVVIDDVVAGLVGCAILHGVRVALGGWW